MRISDRGLRFLTGEEGFLPFVYDDQVWPRKRVDPADYSRAVGKLTIGYGHVLGGYEKLNAIYASGITEAQGRSLLMKDLVTREEAINELVEVPLNQNQFDALVSLVFNVGTKCLARYRLGTKLNAGDYVGAAREFLDIDNSGGHEDPVLKRRRAREASMFLTPVEQDPAIGVDAILASVYATADKVIAKGFETNFR